MIYRTCPYCGAALDPCEICDCREQRSESEPKENMKKAAQGATNTQDGERSNKLATACYSSQFNEE